MTLKRKLATVTALAFFCVPAVATAHTGPVNEQDSGAPIVNQTKNTVTVSWFFR